MFLFENNMRKPMRDAIGKIKSDVRKDVYLEATERARGMRIPPIGNASLTKPSTVPEISLYMRPESVTISGKVADREIPVRNTMTYVSPFASTKKRQERKRVEDARRIKIELSIWFFFVKNPMNSRPVANPPMKMTRPIFEVTCEKPLSSMRKVVIMPIDPSSTPTMQRTTKKSRVTSW